MDISYYSNESDKFSNDLKEKIGIWVSDGNQFKGNGKSFIRVNVATSLENVKDFCDRIKKYLDK